VISHWLVRAEESVTLRRKETSHDLICSRVMRGLCNAPPPVTSSYPAESANPIPGVGTSVPAGAGLAGNEDGASLQTFAGLIGKNVKDGVDDTVRGDNTQNYARERSKKNDESN
jgi:hypothetical protein